MSYQTEWNETKQSSTASHSSSKQSEDAENLPDPWDEDWIAESCRNEDDEMLVMKCTKCGYEKEIPRWVIGEVADALASAGNKATKAGIECPKYRGQMELKSE
jgi:hypothetical protein